MSKLYASITSDSRKTPATSRGHKEINCHVHGWNKGIRVICRLGSKNNPQFEVWSTGGSNGGDIEKLLIV